jgi:hypothetical protein
MIINALLKPAKVTLTALLLLEQLCISFLKLRLCFVE